METTVPSSAFVVSSGRGELLEFRKNIGERIVFDGVGRLET